MRYSLWAGQPDLEVDSTIFGLWGACPAIVRPVAAFNSCLHDQPRGPALNGGFRTKRAYAKLAACGGDESGRHRCLRGGVGSVLYSLGEWGRRLAVGIATPVGSGAV